MILGRLLLRNNILHTYKYSPLQYLSQDYDLASHIPYIVCVHFIHDWQDLQFKVDSKQQIIERFFIAILFTLRVFAWEPV